MSKDPDDCRAPPPAARILVDDHYQLNPTDGTVNMGDPPSYSAEAEQALNTSRSLSSLGPESHGDLSAAGSLFRVDTASRDTQIQNDFHMALALQESENDRGGLLEHTTGESAPFPDVGEDDEEDVTTDRTTVAGSRARTSAKATTNQSNKQMQRTETQRSRVVTRPTTDTDLDSVLDYIGPEGAESVARRGRGSLRSGRRRAKGRQGKSQTTSDSLDTTAAGRIQKDGKTHQQRMDALKKQHQTSMATNAEAHQSELQAKDKEIEALQQQVQHQTQQLQQQQQHGPRQEGSNFCIPADKSMRQNKKDFKLPAMNTVRQHAEVSLLYNAAISGSTGAAQLHSSTAPTSQLLKKNLGFAQQDQVTAMAKHVGMLCDKVMHDRYHSGLSTNASAQFEFLRTSRWLWVLDPHPNSKISHLSPFYSSTMFGAFEIKLRLVYVVMWNDFQAWGCQSFTFNGSGAEDQHISNKDALVPLREASSWSREGGSAGGQAPLDAILVTGRSVPKNAVLRTELVSFRWSDPMACGQGDIMPVSKIVLKQLVRERSASLMEDYEHSLGDQVVPDGVRMAIEAQMESTRAQRHNGRLNALGPDTTGALWVNPQTPLGTITVHGASQAPNIPSMRTFSASQLGSLSSSPFSPSAPSRSALSQPLLSLPAPSTLSFAESLSSRSPPNDAIRAPPAVPDFGTSRSMATVANSISAAEAAPPSSFSLGSFSANLKTNANDNVVVSSAPDTAPKSAQDHRDKLSRLVGLMNTRGSKISELEAAKTFARRKEKAGAMFGSEDPMAKKSDVQSIEETEEGEIVE